MPLRLNGSTSGYSQIDAPAVAGNNTLTLPGGNGTNGQLLQTNGSGVLSWATVASGVTEADFYTTSGSMSGGALTVLSASRVGSPFSVLGTGMSVSSGVFTFPSTGVWMVTFNTSFGGNAINMKQTSFTIEYTANNGGAWSGLASQAAYMHNYTASANQSAASASPSAALRISDTSQQKLRFTMSSSTYGDTVQYTTGYALFLKIAS